MKDYFKDYNYKKHCKLVGKVYLPLILFDLTFSYLIIKKSHKRLIFQQVSVFQNLKTRFVEKSIKSTCASEKYSYFFINTF